MTSLGDALGPQLAEVKGEGSARHLLDQGAVWASSGRAVAEQCLSADGPYFE